MSRKIEQELSPEEMLAYIESSGITIESIQGRGPGTGQNPNLAKGSDDLIRAAYDLIHHVRSIQEGNTF